MSNDKDVRAAFNPDTFTGAERISMLELENVSDYRLGIIAGIRWLDEFNRLSNNGDYVLLCPEWGIGILGQGRASMSHGVLSFAQPDPVTIMDETVSNLHNAWTLDRQNQHHRDAFRQRAKHPFAVSFADKPAVPANLRNRVIYIAVMTDEEVEAWPTRDFKAASLRFNGELIVVTPEYRRSV